MSDRWMPCGLMADWLRQRAVTHASTPALIAGRDRVTFSELDRLVDRVAGQMAACGVTAGSRVMVLLPNGVPFVLLTHALVRLGGLMVPLNTRLAVPELVWQIRDARAAFIVHDDEAAVAAFAGQIPGVQMLSWPALTQVTPADVAPRPAIELATPQGILYTSATSGRPKGVLLSFGNHWWSAVASALNLGLRHDDRWLAPLPLFHVGGLAVLWRSVIYGITAMVHETFDPGTVNQAIDRDRVTIVSVVSTMLQRMLDARGGRAYPDTLRCVLLGGGPAPRPLLERCLRLGVPVAPTYGLTEAASQVATLRPDEVARRPGSSGQALFPTEVRIEDGEILVRGPSVMLGYVGRSDETARALRGGWLRTGDLGYLDDDGYLYVTERRDDLIVSGGENVYPAEVEAVLLSHPAVDDAGVVGLPDEEWGQIVAAAVKLRADAQAGPEELLAFCRERLARYKVPRYVWFTSELPRSPSGKLIRRLLGAQAPAPAARASSGAGA
jgi:O-succinylbenzoic acid--CoA ligase